MNHGKPWRLSISIWMWIPVCCTTPWPQWSPGEKKLLKLQVLLILAVCKDSDTVLPHPVCHQNAYFLVGDPYWPSFATATGSGLIVYILHIVWAYVIYIMCVRVGVIHPQTSRLAHSMLDSFSCRSQGLRLLVHPSIEAAHHPGPICPNGQRERGSSSPSRARVFSFMKWLDDCHQNISNVFHKQEGTKCSKMDEMRRLSV